MNQRDSESRLTPLPSDLNLPRTLRLIDISNCESVREVYAWMERAFQEDLERSRQEEAEFLRKYGNLYLD